MSNLSFVFLTLIGGSAAMVVMFLAKCGWVSLREKWLKKQELAEEKRVAASRKAEEDMLERLAGRINQRLMDRGYVTSGVNEGSYDHRRQHNPASHAWVGLNNRVDDIRDQVGKGCTQQRNDSKRILMLEREVKALKAAIGYHGA